MLPDKVPLLEVAIGTRVCHVKHPQRVIQRIAQGMSAALHQARSDDRIPRQLLADMGAVWQTGLAYA
ncbi:MAG: hypothetical protein RI907_2165 [Pseudomonadota bacterium]|jgi:hypothetical protein